MRRFKGFGARRSFEKPGVENATASTSPQCFPMQFYSPVRESFHRRRSVDSRVTDPAARVVVDPGVRRRSVDDSLHVDLQAVRKEWKNCSSSSSMMMSSSTGDSSFSSSNSWPSSDASAASDPVSSASGASRVVVVAFDANAKESGVGATVLWAFRNVAMHRGDVLVLVGVVDTVRGPLGYKVQVNDQTWLGANKKFLDEEMKAKSLFWSGQFRKRCEDAGVSLVVDVRAAPHPEVVIVHEATTRGAAHVVLDKSLGNKRRRYYLERLACDVTRMRRGGGVDMMLRTTTQALPPSSPTSVLPFPQQRPPRNSFNSSVSRLVRLVEEKNANSSPAAVTRTASRRQSSNPTIDEDELFCIDHDFLTRRVEMLLEPEPDLADHRRLDQLIVDDEGYESDDLFSLAADGASRRPSLAVFAMDSSARNSLRSSISRTTQLATG